MSDSELSYDRRESFQLGIRNEELGIAGHFVPNDTIIVIPTVAEGSHPLASGASVDALPNEERGGREIVCAERIVRGGERVFEYSSVKDKSRGEQGR